MISFKQFLRKLTKRNKRGSFPSTREPSHNALKILNGPGGDTVPMTALVMVSHSKKTTGVNILARLANKVLGTKGLKVKEIIFDGEGQSLVGNKQKTDYFSVVKLEVTDKVDRDKVIELLKTDEVDVELG